MAKGLRQLKVKDKAIQEIRVWKLINLHKRVIKIAKKLHKSKVNQKARNAQAKNRNIFQKKNQVKNKRVKKVREKIWDRPI
jgi:hypothetical protein